MIIDFLILLFSKSSPLHYLYTINKVYSQVIFNYFINYITKSLILQKLLCPILTATEGFILGVGAKMFTIAGPVIVYGTVAGVVYGVVYWLLQMI